ncbi:MAG TPA: leucyl aminopeptidase [Gemmatimonadales bacterium]|jgi:leucyl aminopeptidase
MPLVVTHRVAKLSGLQTPLLVILVAKGPLPAGLTELDRAADGTINRCWESGDFTGARDETALLYPAKKAPERILLVGLGDPQKVTDAALRRAAMIAGKRARILGVPSAIVAFLPEAAAGIPSDRAGQALAEGIPFGAWHFPDLKRPPEVVKPAFEKCELLTLAADESFARGVSLGSIIASGQAFTRGLQVLPGNTCTPEYVASAATELGKRHGIAVTVLDRAAIIKAGMKALIAVAQGSAVEPRFIVLDHRGSDAAPVVLIGKGVTFDSGGISIKPAQNMEDMKYDMSGGAAVLGTFDVIGQLKPKQHVIGLIPLCENMPSGTSYKPGDVVGSHLGKTIEVVNTDAEGRLILADALSWARQYKPAAVINCATLTGAIVIGLGHTASGVMGTSDEVIRAVIAAGERADERAWELPLWDEYRELIKSDIADMKNSGGRPAGSITAGWFLREFAEEYPWAHLDIAGTAYTDRELPTQVKGPTGVMVRLFTEFLLARS